MGPTDRVDELRRVVANPAAVLILAMVEGEIIGTLLGTFDGWRGNMYRLVVHPSRRRKGVARQLVRHVPLSQDPSGLALFGESTLFVADHRDEVVGFGGHKGNYISWLFVHPSHRRRGVARALVTKMVGQLQGPITLNVVAGNHAARQLYAGLGFTIAQEFTGKFNGHDVQVLALTYDQAPRQ